MSATLLARMNAQLRPIHESDLPQLSAFLRDAFQAPPAAPFATEQMLRWKFLHPNPMWEGGLSYILEKNGDLTAHAGVCPVLFRTPAGRRVRCGTIIDWAADRATPGAGLVVCRQLMQMAEATFLIGGTETTWAMTARLGFRQLFEAHVYARWVCPVKEFWLRPKSPRAVLRLLHGVAHASFDRPVTAEGWEVSPVSRFGETVEPLLASMSRLHSAPERTVAELNHRLDSPATTTRGYLVRKDRENKGCAIVSIGRWEAKILDVRLDSDDPQDWTAAYAVLSEALRKEPSVCRIRALASVPLVRGALQANRYWVNETAPVSFYGPTEVVEGLVPISLQFFDCDLGYYDA